MYTAFILAYVFAAVTVGVYTTSEFLLELEHDHENFIHNKDYVPMVKTPDKLLFVCNIIVPGWNLFCALIIIGIEASDWFVDWVMRRVVDREHRKTKSAKNFQ